MAGRSRQAQYLQPHPIMGARFLQVERNEATIMRRQWQIITHLAGIASVCLTGGCAIGQGADAPQYPQYIQYPQGAPPVVSSAETTLTPDQLDTLLAPIALYPDPLLSLMFPAATYPQDIVAAEQWLLSTPNPTEADIAAQGWDASIKGLVHYPSVLKMMSEQINWTQILGASFASRQQGVLDSVQRLRARAQAAQNLQPSPQEQVLVDNGAIRIEPSAPDVMYVPQYDPDLVYDSVYPISFGIGFPIGLWCDNDFDWRSRYIVNGGGWYSGWRHPEEWDRRRPAWDRRPTGWVAAPRPWVRTASRPVPRLTPAAVSHLGLDQPHETAAAHTVRGAARQGVAAPQVGRQPALAATRNAFDITASRAEVQQATQRARLTTPQPTAVRPPPVVAARPTLAVQPQMAPRQPAIAPAPRPTVAAPPRYSAPAPSPRASAVPAQTASRAAPSNAFYVDSAAETRAQSARGRSSRQQ